MPSVTVLMPVRNGARFLEEALESVRVQTDPDFELLVIDDGSTDDTPGILARWPDRRLRVIRQPDSRGLAAALNLGFGEARGAWVMRADADDRSAPERLAQQRAAASRTENIALVFGKACPIEGSPGSNALPRCGRSTFPRSQSVFEIQLCYRAPVAAPTWFMNREAFLRAGGSSPADGFCQDFGVEGRIIREGAVVGVNEVLVHRHRHAAQITATRQLEMQADHRRIGLRHCRQLLWLKVTDAARAFAALSEEPGSGLREWVWFLRYCVPRLRLRDKALSRWLAAETLRRSRHFSPRPS